MSKLTDKSPVIPFGLHIPKCAGTTLLERFYELYGDGLYQSTSIAKNFKHGIPDLSDYSGRWPFAFYYGHHLHSEMLRNIEGHPFLFTILRNPLDRAVSHYRYQNRLRISVDKDPLSVDQFFSNMQSMCDFIIKRFMDFVDEGLKDASPADKAWSVLKKFHHVGYMDSLQETASVLSAVTGNEYDFSKLRNAETKITKEEMEIRD